MLSKLQNLYRQPLNLLLLFWPLVLVTPHLPGVPRPAVDGLPWRQELFVSLLLTASLILVWLRRNSLSHEALRKNSRAITFLALFVCWILLSSIWANDRYQALHLAMQWTCYLFFFVLLLCASTKAIRKSIPILVVVVWILIISSVLETWFGAPVTDGSLRVAVKPILRASGTFGELMGVCGLLFAGFSLCVSRNRRAVLLGATAVGCWLATLQSLERAPFIATAAGLLLLVVTALIVCQRNQYLRIALLSTALVAIFVSQSLPVAKEPDASIVGRLNQNLQDDSSTHARLLLWAIGFEMLKAYPLTGVGGGNYQVSYDDARATFASNHPNSSLVGLNDHLLPMFAHNEYVQMLAELGLVGFALFVGFIVTILWEAFRGLRSGHNRMMILTSGSAIVAFMLSSGASAASFRSIGGGLLLFFAAAIVLRSKRSQVTHRPLEAKIFLRVATATAAVAFTFFSIQATGTTLLALAERSNPTEAERYYKTSLRMYPSSAAANFSYGMWLYSKNRFAESIPVLEKALAGGLNSSICYEYLAAAKEASGDNQAAERTLETAVKVYPRSVFLLTRHAVALQRLGRQTEARIEMDRAIAIDSRACRGWEQLIVNDIDAAYTAATRESDIALPGELLPRAAVFAVLRENEIRNPELSQQGWRQRLRSVDYGNRTAGTKKQEN
ncbi:MAG TPA: O-antigen ligase family protein [Pyrinomonadaceae bacterium]